MLFHVQAVQLCLHCRAWQELDDFLKVTVPALLQSPPALVTKTENSAAVLHNNAMPTLLTQAPASALHSRPAEAAADAPHCQGTMMQHADMAKALTQEASFHAPDKCQAQPTVPSAAQIHSTASHEAPAGTIMSSSSAEELLAHILKAVPVHAMQETLVVRAGSASCCNSVTPCIPIEATKELLAELHSTKLFQAIQEQLQSKPSLLGSCAHSARLDSADIATRCTQQHGQQHGQPAAAQLDSLMCGQQNDSTHMDAAATPQDRQKEIPQPAARCQNAAEEQFLGPGAHNRIESSAQSKLSYGAEPTSCTHCKQGVCEAG